MALRRELKGGSQFDLFVPYRFDLPLLGQRETAERPFFSLAKHKRLKPIHYTNQNSAVWVKMEAMPAYGIASMRGAEILIWAAATLIELKRR